DIVGEVIAANGNHSGVGDSALIENDDFGGTGADIDEANTQLALIAIQGGIGTAERLEDNIVHVKAGAIGGSNQALRRSSGRGDHVRIHFEAHANHAGRILNASLLINNEL